MLDFLCEDSCFCMCCLFFGVLVMLVLFGMVILVGFVVSDVYCGVWSGCVGCCGCRGFCYCYC